MAEWRFGDVLEDSRDNEVLMVIAPRKTDLGIEHWAITLLWEGSYLTIADEQFPESRTLSSGTWSKLSRD